jgi:hypothetical protein
MKQMPILVDSDGWSAEEGEPKRSYRLLRTYRLSDRRTPDITVTIRFMCTFEGSIMLHRRRILLTCYLPAAPRS